jgi:hypothetical protein
MAVPAPPIEDLLPPRQVCERSLIDNHVLAGGDTVSEHVKVKRAVFPAEGDKVSGYLIEKYFLWRI